MSSAFGLAALVGGASVAQASVCSVLTERKADYLGEIIYGVSTSVPLPLTKQDFASIPSSVKVKGEPGEDLEVQNPFALVGDTWHLTPPPANVGEYSMQVGLHKLNIYCEESAKPESAWTPTPISYGLYPQTSVTFNLPSRQAAEPFDGSATVTFKDFKPNGDRVYAENFDYVIPSADEPVHSLGVGHIYRFSETDPKNRLDAGGGILIAGGNITNVVVNSGLTAADSGRIHYTFTVTPNSTRAVTLTIPDVAPSTGQRTLTSSDRSRIANACARADKRIKGGRSLAGHWNADTEGMYTHTLTELYDVDQHFSRSELAEVRVWVDGKQIPVLVTEDERGQPKWISINGPVSKPGVLAARLVCGIVTDPAAVTGDGTLVENGQGFVSSAFTVDFLPDNTLHSLSVSEPDAAGNYTLSVVMKVPRYYEFEELLENNSWEDAWSEGWSVSRGTITKAEYRIGRENIPPADGAGRLEAYRLTIAAAADGGPATLTGGAFLRGGGTEPMTFNFTAPAIATTPSYVLELPIRTSQAQPTMTFPDGSIGWIRIGRDYIGDQEEWKMENKLPGFSLETMCRIGGADQAWTGKSSGSNLWGGCGSPNAELNIEGVAMRLTGPEASKYTIAVTCDVTGSGPMTVADGVLCGPPGPGGGLQSVSATITSRP
jgi:hypothetical protein